MFSLSFWKKLLRSVLKGVFMLNNMLDIMIFFIETKMMLTMKRTTCVIAGGLMFVGASLITNNLIDWMFPTNE
jgi:deoxyhypusine synthase